MLKWPHSFSLLLMQSWEKKIKNCSVKWNRRGECERKSNELTWRWKYTSRDRKAENKTRSKMLSPPQGMEMRAKIRAKRKIKWEEEGGREVGKLERAVWLIETESTDRKSLSCHKTELQSLFILLTSSLCFSTLSLDHPCITSLPLSHTHQKHGRPDRRMLWKKGGFVFDVPWEGCHKGLFVWNWGWWILIIPLLQHWNTWLCKSED